MSATTPRLDGCPDMRLSDVVDLDAEPDQVDSKDISLEQSRREPWGGDEELRRTLMAERFGRPGRERVKRTSQ